MQPTIRTRHTPPAELGLMIAVARMRRRWRRREAARIIGLSPSHMFDLECGRRCPSVTVAHRLADELTFTDAERTQLFASAVTDTGEDHPLKRSA